MIYKIKGKNAKLKFAGKFVDIFKTEPLIPDEYQEVDYIEGHGTEYIDTGITVNTQNLITEAKYLLKSGYTQDNTIGGVRKVGGNLTYLKLPANCYVGKLEFTGYINSAYTIDNPYDTEHVVRSEYKSGETICYVDGVVKGTSDVTGTLNCGQYSITVFAMNDAGEKKWFLNGRIYYWKLLIDGELIRDLVPVYRKADNVVGMFDTVSRTFFTNAGEGAFTYG